MFNLEDSKKAAFKIHNNPKDALKNELAECQLNL